jgi:hypothetical protein
MIEFIQDETIYDYFHSPAEGVQILRISNFLYSLPPILFIQLKRFKYTKNGPSKTHTYFEFHS